MAKQKEKYPKTKQIPARQGNKTMQRNTPIATTTTTSTTKRTSDLPPVGALIPSVCWRRNRVSTIQRRDYIGIYMYIRPYLVIIALFGHICTPFTILFPL